MKTCIVFFFGRKDVRTDRCSRDFDERREATVVGRKVLTAAVLQRTLRIKRNHKPLACWARKTATFRAFRIIQTRLAASVVIMEVQKLVWETWISKHHARGNHYRQRFFFGELISVRILEFRELTSVTEADPGVSRINFRCECARGAAMRGRSFHLGGSSSRVKYFSILFFIFSFFFHFFIFFVCGFFLIFVVFFSFSIFVFVFDFLFFLDFFGSGIFFFGFKICF